MFQKSLLKNFSKSFNAPDESYTALYAFLNQSSLEFYEIARLKKASEFQDEIILDEAGIVEELK